MKKTTNYGLALYEKEDKMSITAEENSLNANMEIIDSKLKEIESRESDNEYDEAIEELKVVANKIKKYQTPETLTISLMSDSHYSRLLPEESTKRENAETGEMEVIVIGREDILSTVKKMNWLANLCHIDAVGNLGDIINGHDEKEGTLDDMATMLNASTKDLKTPLIITRGNHDDNGWYIYEYDEENNKIVANTIPKNQIVNDLEWYNYMFSSNEKYIVIDENNKAGGYGYLDIEKAKTRVFLVNTSDIPYVSKEDDETQYKYQSYGAAAIRNAQLNFIANALHFNDKENPNEWGALFLMHIPLETSAKPGFRLSGEINPCIAGYDVLLGIIKAFKNGANFSYDGEIYYGDPSNKLFSDYATVTANYLEKGKGEVIALINGHAHIDNYTTKIGYERSLSRDYAYISVFGNIMFSNLIVNRENKTFSLVKYGKVGDRDTLKDLVRNEEFEEFVENGEITLPYNQFNPPVKNLFNGIDENSTEKTFVDTGDMIDVHIPYDAESNPDTVTNVVKSYKDQENSILSKVIFTYPHTQYRISDNFDGTIRGYDSRGKYVQPVNKTIKTLETGEKIITTANDIRFIVVQFNTDVYTDYENFKIYDYNYDLVNADVNPFDVVEPEPEPVPVNLFNYETDVLETNASRRVNTGGAANLLKLEQSGERYIPTEDSFMEVTQGDGMTTYAIPVEPNTTYNIAGYYKNLHGIGFNENLIGSVYYSSTNTALVTDIDETAKTCKIKTNGSTKYIVFSSRTAWLSGFSWENFSIIKEQ